MASKVAPPKNTGGGGFVFEADVCAWLLAAVLVAEPVFGPDFGAPIRVDFQTRADGWFLDDVLVTTAADAREHRFSLSVKSSAQFTATSSPADFVTAAWEQYLHIASPLFDASLDFVGIVTAPLSAAAASAVSGLTEKARANDPSLFPGRLATPNWATADERALFASFACPSALGPRTDVDTARLLQRLRFLQHDFAAADSNSENGALEMCRRAVRSHTAEDARSLWGNLRDLASELRPRAGSLTLEGLVERLKARASLADYPEHASDWVILDARSSREAGLVRDLLAGRIRLPRDQHVEAIIERLAASVQFAVLGRSGVGKSALAKGVFERRRANGERTVWIDASSLDRAADFGAFEASLQLRHPLTELLAGETSPAPVVIIDGIDRLYADHAFRATASLLAAASGGSNPTRWRVLAVCQSQEWPRVHEALQRAGAPVAAWHAHEVKALQPVDLSPVRGEAPALTRLLLHPHVSTLLTNLKLLDLVVRRLDGGSNIDASAWVGESSVAEWFWDAEVDGGADRLARGRFVRGLAEAQADQLAPAISVDALDVSSLSAAQSLVADQLVVELPGDRLAFAHDLYGDWARLRILLNHRADLAGFLQKRHESPLWHRAIRLLGIHVLERANGVAEWKALMSAFASGKLTVVRDLLLEAPAFAMNARPLLDSIFPDLVAGDGVLLQRLLARFLVFATVPNERMQALARAVGVDVNVARAAYRHPHWPYWLDVLKVLHTHCVAAVRVAASEVAKVVEMWLDFAPKGSVLRDEAADLSIMLGRLAIDSRDHYGDQEDRRRFYKCALMAAQERPDEAAVIARTAAERVPRPAVEAGDSNPRRPRSRSMFSTGVMPDPWPDGPLARVDDDFQKVVLDTACIQQLYRSRPAVVREVILAALLEEPHEQHWSSSRLSERNLGVTDLFWHPAFYTRGPFLPCLRENFEEGLELIMQLVEFTTERSNEDAARELEEWRTRAEADGRSEEEIQEATRNVAPQFLMLHDGTNEIKLTGDAGSYGWSARVTLPQGYSPIPPSAVASALMALEQYFYQRLEAGEDVADDVAKTLARTRCVAPLGVLIDVGKRSPSLFDGPLRTLLSAPEVYSWDIRKYPQHEPCRRRRRRLIADSRHGDEVSPRWLARSCSAVRRSARPRGRVEQRRAWRAWRARHWARARGSELEASAA